MRLPFQKVSKEEIQKMFEDKTKPGEFDNEYVVLTNVNKVYGNNFHAVYDFNLTIKKNEFIVFVGPSGCGKSTTLRMIAGLEDISSGELKINGEVANDLLPKDRDVAMVFQNYALYPNMTVFKNMAFSLKMRHFPKDIIQKRVEDAAQILEISDQLNKKPKELSGGQRQRVALGRAIVRNARIFLMDEPLSNLDAKLRVQMRSEIIRLHKQLKATTIYVTHDQTEAMTMADRIVVMKQGYVQQIGTPKEIYRHPANVFVASFIGSPAMNIISCKYKDGELVFEDKNVIKLPAEMVKKHDEYYRKTYAEVTRDFPLFKEELDKELAEFNKKHHRQKDIDEFNAKYAELLKEKEEYITYLDKAMHGKEHDIKFGIRPEAIEQVEKAGKDILTTEVKLSEMLGEEYFVHFDFGGRDVLAKVFTEKNVDTGATIHLEMRKDKIHLFDSHSEKAIIQEANS